MDLNCKDFLIGSFGRTKKTSCKDCKGSGVVKTGEFEYQQCPCMEKKHGGKRPNAGRPKLKKSQKKEETVVMRIPISKVAAVLATIGKA